MKRITYDWFCDFLYTLFFVLVVVPLFFVGVTYFLEIAMPISELLFITLIYILILSLVIGFRPIIALFFIPDTIYMRGRYFFDKNEYKFAIENINKVVQNDIGSGRGSITYYQIFVDNKNPNEAKFYLVVDRYDFFDFLNKKNVVTTLIEMGLDEDKVVYSKRKLKHILGFRDKIKK